MKTKFLLKAFSFLFLLVLCSEVSYSQENKIIAEIHNILLDNTSKDKVIQIRFLNCSKSDFETLYKKALQNTNLPAFRQAYSSESSIGSIHFSKSSEITTGDVKLLLNQLNVSNAIFDEKKILVSDLTKHQFSNREKSIQNERTEK